MSPFLGKIYHKLKLNFDFLSIILNSLNLNEEFYLNTKESCCHRNCFLFYAEDVYYHYDGVFSKVLLIVYVRQKISVCKSLQRLQFHCK